MKKVLKSNKMAAVVSSVLLTSAITTTFPFNVISVKATTKITNLHESNSNYLTNHQEHHTSMTTSKHSTQKIYTSKIETISKITKNSITIGKKTFKFSKTFSGVFGNTTALKKARVQFTYDANHQIKNVSLIELNSPGKASKKGDTKYTNNIVFDGKNTKFNGTLRVNANYITIKNITINNNLDITPNVKSVFKTSKVVVKGKTTITNQSEAIKSVGGSDATNKVSNTKFYNSLSFTASTLNGSTNAITNATSPSSSSNLEIIFDGSNLSKLEVKSPKSSIQVLGKTIVSDLVLSSNAILNTDSVTKINKVSISNGVNTLSLNGNIGTLTIQSSSPVTINGKAKINTFTNNSNGSSVNVNISGTINNLIEAGTNSILNIDINAIILQLNILKNSQINSLGVIKKLSTSDKVQTLMLNAAVNQLEVKGNSKITLGDQTKINSVMTSNNIILTGGLQSSIETIDLMNNANKLILNVPTRTVHINTKGTTLEIAGSAQVSNVLLNTVSNILFTLPQIGNILASEMNKGKIELGSNTKVENIQSKNLLINENQLAQINKINGQLVQKPSGLSYDQIVANIVLLKINALPELNKITITNDLAIKDANDSFTQLTAFQKTLVGLNYQEKLAKSVEIITNIKAATAVTTLIDKLPSVVNYTHKIQIESVRAAYEALSIEQKALVLNITDLKTAEDQLIVALADKAAADKVSDLIKALPETVMYSDEAKITEARTEYDLLSAIQKALVENEIDLTNAEAKLVVALSDKDAADVVSNLIAALPISVKYFDETQIKAARKSYEDLSSGRQALVTNLALLQVAEANLIIAINDKEKADAVSELITLLPTLVKHTDKVQIEAARAAYNLLTEAQKDLVSNESILVSAETNLTIALADKAAADNVSDLIRSLPEIVMYTDQAKINEARTKYDLLTSNQKVLVENESDLINAEAKLVDALSDKAAADVVINLISALPVNVSYSDEIQIKAARQAFDNLSAKCQDLVVNVAKLVDAEVKLTIALDDKQKADNVTDLINALPNTVDYSHKSQIEAVRSAYNALTTSQRTLVLNEASLQSAEAKLAIIVSDKAAADHVQALIDALPTDVKLEHQANIEAARAAYNALTATQKTYVTVAPLEAAEQKLKLLMPPMEIQSNAITNFDFANVAATSAKLVSKVITTTDFQTTPREFTISDGTITIPIKINWNVPLSGFTIGQVMGGVIDSFIQDYCNAHGIDLMKRPMAAFGTDDTFQIISYSSGSSSNITLGGKDWGVFFDNSQSVGTNADTTKSKTFTVSDGTKQATISLSTNLSNIDNVITRINQRLSASLVAAQAVKVDANHFKIVASSSSYTITIGGTDKSYFFSH